MTGVTSKLKDDRNYQPPRNRTRQLSNQNSSGVSSQKRAPGLQRQDTIKSEVANDDYGDDFEAAEEENEEDVDADDEDAADQQLMVKNKEAWLYDQAIRGRARQKLLLDQQTKAKLLGLGGYHEKESSKDSAYGFSGGENSRLHTREPTPDTANHSVQPRIINAPFGGKGGLSRGPPPPVCQNPSLRKQFSASSFGPNRRFSPTRKAMPVYSHSRISGPPCNNIVDTSNPQKVDFLNTVTKDILRKGCFTEKGIKRALESHLIAGHSVTLTTTEKAELVGQLKQHLGLDDNNQRSTRPPPPSTPPKTSNSDSSSSIKSSPTNIIVKKKKNSSSPGVKNAVVKIQDVDDDIDELESFDDDLSSILRDESDMDIVELLKTTIRNKSHPDHIVHHSGKSKSQQEQPEMPRETLPVQTKLGGDKLFESLNLTNLNVSFNSANMHEAKRRLEESRTQALLLKSFAYNSKDGDETNEEEGVEEKGDENYRKVSKLSKNDRQQEQSENSSRSSSNLYQSDSEQNNDDDEEFEADPDPALSDNDNCTTRSPSVVDDEDIPFESEIE